MGPRRILVTLATLVAMSCHPSTEPPADGSGAPPIAPGSFATGIPATFFAIGIQHLTTPFPFTTPLGALPASGVRLWDSGVNWSQVETCNAGAAAGFVASDPANPCYRWTMLDGYVNRNTPSMDILYTFGIVPEWAADTARFTPPSPNGCSAATHACLPPRDINPDGTGADAIWTSYVTAVVTRYRGRIRYYELFNEPDAQNFWHGTIQQMVRMSRDASAVIRSIDPEAKILSPSFHGPSAASWFQNQFLANGGAATFDIINFHGRAQANNRNPDNFLASYAQARSVIQGSGLADRPFWDDEGGPLDGEVADTDNTAAYVARAYIVRASTTIARFYYYEWDAKAPYGLSGTAAATAYAVTAGWLTGALMGPCTQSGTRWSCGLTRPNGYQAQLIWDASQGCVNGACSTVPAAVDAPFVRYYDLTGASYMIVNHAVPVGIKPVMIQDR